MPDAVIVNLDNGVQRILRYDGEQKTFMLDSERIRATALAPIDPVFEDFMDVACAIFFADSSFSRGGDKGADMGAGWRRRFHITIPVQDIGRWTDPAVVDALTQVACFLTDDAFIFQFVGREPRIGRQGLLALDPAGAAFEAEEVILFSGGLDSFTGALEALSTSHARVLLVSHRSAPKVMPRQDRLAAYLTKRFPNRVLHVKVEAHRIGPEARDTTQRSRTLLFAALGHAVAQSFGARRISFYENGVVSHNLPIGPQVIGSMATRTTHPFALHLLNQLLTLLRPASPPIRNGYEWLTKKEVVQRIVQHGAADQIRRAVSCTSVREQTTLHPHCGTCSQCLDRRFAILAAGLEAEDPSEGYKTDVLLGRSEGSAARMRVEWTRHALRLASMTPTGLLTGFGSDFTRILAGHPDLTPDQAAQMTLQLHHRHAAVVHDVLTSAIRDNASHITNGDLDAGSLLMMHVARGRGSAAPTLPPEPPMTESRPALPASLPDEDYRRDPNGPLEVAFFMSGELHMITVKGLCDIAGIQAKMAHELKIHFDANKSAGLAPDDHHYVNFHQDQGWQISKAAVRQHVHRCRKTLATSYEDLFGFPPSAPLLMQSKPQAGYRLDPQTRIRQRV